MTGASEMKLLNYKVLKTTFELNEDFEFKPGKIDIQPSFKRDVLKIDNQHYKIALGIKISKEINKGPIPFDAEVVISSVFELPNWESEAANSIAVNNATAIMFPYLRTLMATLTMNGNVPPYMLPIMNISILLTDPKKK
jgi:preprotein translocase subunit SecB